MTLSTLPNEINHQIFANLTGKDVIACRGVCRRMKQAVDELGDRVWEKLCKRDHSRFCEDAYHKACLSWRELYKSLTLWNKLQSATMKYHIMTTEADHFEILQNGIAAVATSTGRLDEDLETIYYSDTILYYDLETLEERNRENLDFLFKKLKENEYVIAVKDNKKRLCLIQKANKKTIVVGTAAGITDFRLFGDVVFFRNKEKIINIGTIVDNDIKIKSLGKLMDQIILSVEYKKNNDLNILTVIYNDKGKKDAYNLYTLTGENLRHACRMRPDVSSVINGLDAYGFNWKKKCIYTSLFQGQLLLTGGIFIHSKILVYKKDVDIHICYDPYSASGEFRLDTATPLKSINLMEMNMHEESKYTYFRNSYHIMANACKRTQMDVPCGYAMRRNDIKKIDVVETENGHKVFVWLETKVAVIKFTHTYI